MRLIGITSEEVALHDEWRMICAALDSGLSAIHLRKPASSEEDVATLLREIPCEYHARIVLHDHFSLLGEFDLGGVHLNRRHPTPPAEYRGQLSSSCHSMEEIRGLDERFEYAFLSPIFSSISKVGYESRFTLSELETAHAEGVIDYRVVALGGVTRENISVVQRCGFGGAAVLGYLWQQWDEAAVRRQMKRLREVIQ